MHLHSFANLLIMPPSFFSLFFYNLNKELRNFSNAVIGNYYEAHRDLVLITGGLSGLGDEIVKKIIEKNGKIIVLDINDPPKKKTKNIFYFKCDVGDKNQLEYCYNKIVNEIGIVTVLINNAAITYGKTIIDLDFKEIERIIQTNLLSSFYTIKIFLPDMLQVKRGYIITIASVLGYMSPAKLSAYGASKSGLISLHESLTYELGLPSENHNGIKTLLICPGQMKTKLFRGVLTPSSFIAPEIDPKYLASQVLSAIELGKRGQIILPIYGSFLPFFKSAPWPIVEIVRNFSGIDKSMKSFKPTSNYETKTPDPKDQFNTVEKKKENDFLHPVLII